MSGSNIISTNGNIGNFSGTNISATSITGALLQGNTLISQIGGVRVPLGTSGGPSYTFLSDLTTGLYASNVGNLDISASGSRVANWTSTNCTLFTSMTNASQPYAFYVKTSSQAASAGVYTLITWDTTPDQVQNNPVDITGPNTIFQAKSAGTYIIICNVVTEGGGTDALRGSYITINDSVPSTAFYGRYAVTNTFLEGSSIVVRRLATNDQLRCFIFSPDTRLIYGSATANLRCSFQIYRLG